MNSSNSQLDNLSPSTDFRNKNYGNISSCDIMWVGLSAKMSKDFVVETPLSPSTKSGQVVSQIEESFSHLNTYKTNLVKSVPLDNKGKLRYPNDFEIASNIGIIEDEINTLRPRLVILLGEKVGNAISKYYDMQRPKRISPYDYPYIEHRGVCFLTIQHPSFMAVYKRSEMSEYKNGVNKIVSRIF